MMNCTNIKSTTKIQKMLNKILSVLSIAYIDLNADKTGDHPTLENISLSNLVDLAPVSL